MKTETLTITLSQADAQGLRDILSSGDFASESDVFHHALDRLQTSRSQASREERLANIQEKFAKAAANPGRISSAELDRMLEEAAREATAPRS